MEIYRLGEEDLDLEDRMDVAKYSNVDIGGTPNNIAAQDKASIAYRAGLKPEQLIIVLDPFNQARQMRTLLLEKIYNPNTNKTHSRKIKFNIGPIEDNAVQSAEQADPPSSEDVRKQFERAKPGVVGDIINHYGQRIIKNKDKLEARYDEMAGKISNLADESSNLREYMNSVIEYLFAPIKTIKLEEVYSKHADITLDIIKKLGKIQARTFCKRCGDIEHVNFIYNNGNIQVQYRIKDKKTGEFVEEPPEEELACCGISGNELIKSGSFIPEEGMLPILTYLNGFTMFAKKGSPYIRKAVKHLKEYGLEGKKAFIIFPETEDKVPRFQNLLLSGLLNGERNNFV